MPRDRETQEMGAEVIQFFKQRNAPPAVAVAAMAEVCGALLGQVANSPADLQEGIGHFIDALATTAVASMARKIAGRAGNA